MVGQGLESRISLGCGEHPPRPTAARPPRPRRAWQVFRTLVGGAGGFSPPPNPLRCTHIQFIQYDLATTRVPTCLRVQATTVNSQLSLTRDLSIKTLMPQSSSAAHYMLYSILYLEPARTRHLLLYCIYTLPWGCGLRCTYPVMGWRGVWAHSNQHTVQRLGIGPKDREEP